MSSIISITVVQFRFYLLNSQQPFQLSGRWTIYKKGPAEWLSN